MLNRTLALALLALTQTTWATPYLLKLKSPQTASTLKARFTHKVIRSDVLLVDIDAQTKAHLESHPEVAWLEPDTTLSLYQNEPNDLDSDLWGLKNPRGFDLNVLPAWSLSTGSKDVVVAVIDTGVALTHPDIRNNLWINTKEASGQTGVDDDGNGYVDDIHGYDFALENPRPQDTRGHGTHLAGTIGAEGNNRFGVVGVNWRVSIMALKMFPRYSDARISDAIRAIDYAVKNGARVINASWGQSSQGGQNPEAKLLQEAIERAAQAGVLFVAAGGNYGSDTDREPNVPATMPVETIVAVGAMNRRGGRPSFSNYGAKSIHVFAPGEDILSLDIDGTLTEKSGTSMAAPHVSGVAALMLSVHPQLTAQEIKTILIETCKPNAELQNLSLCRGHVDSAAAVQRAHALRSESH